MVNGLPTLLGADRSLFALHYAGNGTGAPVLVCPPLLDEGTRCHWLLRRACQTLAAHGHDALLTHFTGHGYSDQSDRPPSIERWQEDMALTVERLRRLAPENSELDLLACRFAAALIPTDSRWGRIVLWDPVIEGRRWLQDLEEKRERLRVRRHGERLQAEEYAGRVQHPSLVKALKHHDTRPAAIACAVLHEVYSAGSEPQNLSAFTAATRTGQQHVSDYDWTLPRERMVHDPALLDLLLAPWKKPA